MRTDRLTLVLRSLSRRRAFMVATSAILVLVSQLSCAKPPDLSEGVRFAMKDLALRHQEPHAIDLYVDASGSMRGFSLAATHNESGGGEPLAALLKVLDGMAKGPGEGLRWPDAGNPAQSVQRWKARTYLAGKQLRPANPVSLRLAFFGTSPWGLGAGPVDGALGPSLDCRRRWVGTPSVREQIDLNLSHPITCLAPVFQQIAAYKGLDRAFVVVTDSEQVATPGGMVCGAPANLAEVQASVADLLEEGKYFGMVVKVVLPYQPWWSEDLSGSKERFCSCDRKALFLYLFSASPAFLNATWESLRSEYSRISGSVDAMSKIELTPQPAHVSRLKLALLDEWSYFVEHDEETPWERPPQGEIPVVRLALERNDSPTRIGLQLDSLEFESSDPALDQAELRWSVLPLTVSTGVEEPRQGRLSPAEATSEPTIRNRLVPDRRPNKSLEIGLVDSIPSEPMTKDSSRVIAVDFHEGPNRISLSKWEGKLPGLVLEVRTWGMATGAAAYVLQLEAHRRGSPKQWRTGAGVANVSECAENAADDEYLRLAKPGAAVGRWILWVTWSS